MSATTLSFIDIDESAVLVGTKIAVRTGERSQQRKMTFVVEMGSVGAD